MTANAKGLLSVIEFEKQILKYMYTVEQIKTAMTKAKLSYWQMDVLLTSLGKLQKPEPQQLLQQTTCKTLLPDVEQIIKSRIEHFESSYHSYEANELRQALSTIERLVPPSMFEDFIRQ